MFSVLLSGDGMALRNGMYGYTVHSEGTYWNEFWQIFGQVFDQVFDQVFGQGFDQKYSVQFYWDGEIQCTVLLGQKIQGNNWKWKQHLRNIDKILCTKLKLVLLTETSGL